jgi:hypothetical protein
MFAFGTVLGFLAVLAVAIEALVATAVLGGAAMWMVAHGA